MTGAKKIPGRDWGQTVMVWGPGSDLPRPGARLLQLHPACAERYPKGPDWRASGKEMAQELLWALRRARKMHSEVARGAVSLVLIAAPEEVRQDALAHLDSPEEEFDEFVREATRLIEGR